MVDFAEIAIRVLEPIRTVVRIMLRIARLM